MKAAPSFCRRSFDRAVMQIECSGTLSSCATVPDALLPDWSRMLVYWHGSLCACQGTPGCRPARHEQNGESRAYKCLRILYILCTFYVYFSIFFCIFVMAYFMHNLCIEPDSEKHRERPGRPPGEARLPSRSSTLRPSRRHVDRDRVPGLLLTARWLESR